MADKDEKELEETEVFDEEDGDGEGTEHQKGGRKKLILILVAVTLLLLALIGAGLYFSGLLDPLLGIEDTDGEKEEVVVLGTAFYKLEDITLNLNGDEEKTKFFKLGITIVLMDDVDIPIMEALAPRIIDNITGYLRELKPGEIAGTANFNRLRENILLRVRAAVAPTVVSDVLFQSALVQ